ncbi:ras-related protein Rab-39B [Lingula anatina]|uniref:Ras-related protein Rab-39B n=1 Tax=Lingula anatina TaxID=7574 RepID=A0A1S3IBA4_LINAN|nr:ras-related protein Rab-39B [Lingula anatina]|eukprot:XP_013394689.1 ras-related protein Rab-39B [Lingula anatina]
MVEPIFEYQFRLILIGDSTVGKSSLLKYFTEGKFSEVCDPTVGVDFFARLIEVKPGVRVKLQLWDTAGQERFRAITKSYYRNSVGALLVYDITKRVSFENLTGWLEEARQHIEPNKAVFLVVGHKADAEEDRQVTTREGKLLAEHNGLKFLETSAVTGLNVEECFLTVARDVYELLEQGKITVEEGWEGVKNGYARPRETFHVMEGEPEGGGCC